MDIQKHKKSKKKITILMLHLKHGGIEKQTTTMINALINYFDIEIISVYDFGNVAYKIDDRVKIKYLFSYGPEKTKLLSSLKELGFIIFFKELFKLISIYFFKKTKIKKIIKNLDADILFSTRIEFANIISDMKINENIKTITQEHNHIDTSVYGNYVKKATTGIDNIIVMSDYSKRVYEKWVDKNKIIVIPNILDKIPKKSSDLNNNAIISVGRFHPVKNYVALLKVFKLVYEQNSKIKLYLLGGGSEYQKLFNFVRENNLQDNVILPGMLSSDEVERYLLKSDLFVMTSKSECFPMVILEANSCGVPVLSFDIPAGPISIIKNNKNGYLVQNENIESMSNKILEYFKLEDRKKLGNYSKKYSEKFLVKNIIEKWLDILK